MILWLLKIQGDKRKFINLQSHHKLILVHQRQIIMAYGEVPDDDKGAQQ